MDHEPVVHRLGEVAQEYETWAASPLPRIPLGYSIIDSRTNGGAAFGEVVLFTARPNVGKTMFGLNVIRNNPNVPAVFFSLEMQRRYIAARLAAMTFGVSTQFLEREIHDHGTSQSMTTLPNYYPQLLIADEPGLSLRRMEAALGDAEQELGVKPRLIVIDYLELIGGNPAMSQLEAIDKVVRNLKNFARNADAVVLVLHQVGREQGGDGDRPLGMKSGRYGGEQGADYLLAAYKPCLRAGIDHLEYLAVESDFYLQFLKNRAGGQIHPAGRLHHVDIETMLIQDRGT